jgi:hypothetical protein
MVGLLARCLGPFVQKQFRGLKVGGLETFAKSEMDGAHQITRFANAILSLV